MRPHLLMLMLAFVLLFASCKKDNQHIDEGIYSGTFKVVYNSATLTGQTTLELRDSRYNCLGGINRIPAGGSGNYSSGNDKITFTDEGVWTADFDWNLILNGEYNYSFDGNNLKIWATKNNVGYYEYDLRKN